MLQRRGPCRDAGIFDHAVRARVHPEEDIMSADPATLLLHLRLAGMLLAVIVVINLFVPHRLRWRDEMAGLSLVNRQIVNVHSFFIVLIVALCAALLLISGD